MTATSPARSKHEPRVEDDALVRGHGRFMDDPRLPNQAYAAFVRSPHAHARVLSVKTEAARAAKKVLAVLTAADMKAAGVGSVSRHPPVPGRGGAKMIMPFRPALAGDKVMHGGDPVAMVVAETRAAAQDAAELVAVDYEELPAVVDLETAMKPGDTQLYPEAPGNLCVDWPGPVPEEQNERDVAKIIAEAPHVARVSVTNQRMVVASLETRGATGVYDAKNDSYTLYACSQGADSLRGQGAAIMGVPNDKLRVITDDVGGAFGMKTPVYPEYPALLVAARQLGRPVHWQSTRSEAFVTDTQARDTVTHVELAVDEKGKFLGLRMRHLCNQGAYVSTAGININTNNFARCCPGHVPNPEGRRGRRVLFHQHHSDRPLSRRRTSRSELRARARGRGGRAHHRHRSGAPAQEEPHSALGDAVSRRRSAISMTAAIFPRSWSRRSRSPTTTTSTSASARRQSARNIAASASVCMLEHSGALPMEMASVAFPGDDKLILGCNVQSTGQSHATVFGRLLGHHLGIDPGKIEHRHGDTAMGLTGFASVGSRSAMCAGNAIVHTADVMLAKGRKVASALLEASEQDIQYRKGNFEVVGTDRKISLFETAKRAKEMAARGEIPESLDTKGKLDTPLTFPNGCHIAEVEIDPDTGAVDIVTYTAVDDCGNPLDMTIVEGQVHGSIAQGSAKRWSRTRSTTR